MVINSYIIVGGAYHCLWVWSKYNRSRLLLQISSMSRLKNGGKKGFVRLSNEDSVMLNESDSEVELLDVTEIKSNHGKKKHGALKARQG